MAKTYVDVVKYIIHTEFEIKGVVDKHDIIGAIFGQCEGLLGEEMDLKELQDSGKLGRIEVISESKLGITKGEVLVPSSMDTASTSLLAAAIESVDKVGPCEAKFRTIKIEDVREDKRKIVTERAKEILKKLSEQLPEARELTTELKEETRIAEVYDYGKERLPAGPEVDSEKELIVVEGRADVINLLRNHINNVIGMGGAKIAKTVIDLSKQKELTLFIDGDRGGELNARKLIQVADVKFIAKAPDGKEVEELARKEIITALRNKVPAQEAFAEKKKFIHTAKTYPRKEENAFNVSGAFGTTIMQSRNEPRERRYEQRSSGDFRNWKGAPRGRGFGGNRRFSSSMNRARYSTSRSFGYRENAADIASAEERAKFEPLLQSLKGSMQAKIYDENMNETAATNVRELVEMLAKQENVYAIVFDGIVTKRLADEAVKHSCKYIIGIRKGKLDSTYGIKVLAF